jgi:predicted ATPase
MRAPDGFRLGKLLYSSTHSEVYEAVRESDGAEVVLKAYLADRATDPDPRARREYEVLRRVAGARIPKALALDGSTDRPLLVLERIPAAPLSRALREGPLDVASWLELASQASETLVGIHEARMLHKDLSPGNVLFDPGTARVWICDFGLSVELGASERSGEPLKGTVGGTLQYIAPEQTGRMNRGCDYRSDLYSLGATLYHALTGRPPFEADDALELIHAHLARRPQAPREMRSELPRALSEMLLKLLRKEPQERYQSAAALLADLRACREQLQQTGRISEDFMLGAAEAPAEPRFTSKLYGRESEAELLRAIYADAAQGRPRTLWIQGAPGAGKSALVDQLRPLLAQTHAYLVTAKFDLYGGRPYAGWIAALSSLVQQLLMESDARLARWRDELNAALGPIAPALVDLVPDLTFVLGELPPAPRLEPREAQARLSLALQRFVHGCATTEHPLVILLDDLQWSDAASRALLEEVLANPPPALLLIGAYRAGHDDPELDTFLAHVPELTRPQVLELGALAPEAATAMLADALERAPADVRELAELVASRTANLPLLIRHFVEHIHARGVLRYAPGAGWRWDPAEIARLELPDSAGALMAGKLDRLAPESRDVLQFASCVGDEFDTELLCELSRSSRLAIWEALCAAADAGLIIPCANGFRFAHDRIREGAQQQLSAEKRAQIHCDTARLLLERTPDPERSPRLAQIVDHLNRVPEMPDDLRVAALRLNCATGKSSLSRGAFAAAADNFAIARRLLRAEDQGVEAKLVLEIFLHSAESAFQLADFAGALEVLDQIDVRALSRLEVARVEAKRIQILALCRSAETCVRHALEVLRRFGVRWPLHPSRLRAQLALWRIEATLLRRRHPEIVTPARAVDPDSIAVLLLVRPSAAALARVDVHLAVLATCLSMRRHLHDGYLTAPGFALAVYATYLYLFLGARKRAQRMAETALSWTERIPDPTAARTRMMVQVLLYPFLMHRRHALSAIDRIVESARENGDPEFAHYARFNETCYLALAGDPVKDMARRFARVAEDVRASQQWYPEAERCRQVYAALAASTACPDALAQAYADDVTRAGIPSAGQGFSATLWLLVLCTFDRHDLAFAHSERLAAALFRISPFVHVVDHTFYRGLAAAALASDARGGERRRYRRVLRRSLRYLKRRARDGPDFVHMELLLQAEQARLARDPARARSLYEKAAERAAQQAFAHHAALAHERHARLLTRLRRDTEAAPMLRRAIAGYREWGAVGKALLLAAEIDGARVSSGR